MLRPAAVNAAEPAGRHDRDAGGAADGERSADGRRADRALHRRRGEVARPDLARRRVEARELVLGQPDADLAVEHADRRRHRARRAHAPLGLEPDGDAFAGREAVRDERRLERDDGAARRAPPARSRSSLLLHVHELDVAEARERPHVAAGLAKAGALVHLDRALVERGDVEANERRPVALAPELEARRGRTRARARGRSGRGEARARTRARRPSPRSSRSRRARRPRRGRRSTARVQSRARRRRRRSRTAARSATSPARRSPSGRHRLDPSRHRTDLGDATRRRLERELGAADDEARGERVAGAGRVDGVDRRRAACSSPSTTIPRAPRLTTRTRRVDVADRLPLALVAEDDVGTRPARARSRIVVAEALDVRPRGEVDADLRAVRRARARAARAAAPAIGSRISE